jgi:Zn-finger nucleic acid-binding protein
MTPSKEEPSELMCPACVRRMVAAHYETLVLDECRSCRGCWYDHGEIRKAASRLPAGPAAPAPELKVRTLSAAPGLHCPRCRSGMNRYLYRGTVEISIEQCDGCGVWLGPGELEKIVTFASAGAASAVREFFSSLVRLPGSPPPARP